MASPGFFDIAKPSDRDLLAMIQLYDDEADRYFFLRKLREKSPGVAEVFLYSMELEVETLFSKVRTSKLVASFLSNHGNAKVEELLRSGRLNVIERSLNGEISIGAKSLDVKKSLGGEKVALLGHQVAFNVLVSLTLATTSTFSAFLDQWRRRFSLIL
uniref:Uncharacterized protein n=1 Tax=Peronospora matthiolae TaxID=2874970 RepID=A0AAV1T0Q1_9STRA